jgi:hypothetical protein
MKGRGRRDPKDDIKIRGYSWPVTGIDAVWAIHSVLVGPYNTIPVIRGPGRKGNR